VREGDEEEDEPIPESGPRIAQSLYDHLPDVRDGLTRLERVILWQLSVCEKEKKGRMVPTPMLYGRVCEYVDVDEQTFMRVHARLIGKGKPTR
jgi:hypothetical protein